MKSTDAHFRSLFALEGRSALVTGGGSGLGLMISRALAAAGAHVYIASRTLATCQAAAREIEQQGGRCEPLSADVSTEQGVQSIVDFLRQRVDRLDILVNNAGRSWGAPFEQFPWKAWAEIMDLNVTGLFSLTRDLVPLLEAAASADHPSRIVNIGSVMGLVPHGFPAYSYAASKAAVHHVTRYLAGELASKHITVNAIAPGPFPSRMTAFFADRPERAEAVEKAVPLGRLGRPEDIAGLITLLCGAGGAYMTGAVIPLDGGMSVYRTPGLEQGL
jgi:NAD(P)-dependent dehydrogenase (short-subunit alcohol dehydrogenase family)